MITKDSYAGKITTLNWRLKGLIWAVFANDNERSYKSPPILELFRQKWAVVKYGISNTKVGGQ